MKYSLRSLMIVVMLAAIGTGAVVTWRKHRQFCLERENFHATSIVTSPSFGGSFHYPPDSERGKAVLAMMREERKRENEEHARLEKEYRAAIWRPWLRLWIFDSYPLPWDFRPN